LDFQRGEEPFCDVNRCQDWTVEKHDPKWNWKSNRDLGSTGPVALLSERTCAVLGWPCNDEGTQQIKALLPERVNANVRNLVRLRFAGSNLVCSKSTQSEFEESRTIIECKPGLFNKWKKDGKC